MGFASGSSGLSSSMRVSYRDRVLKGSKREVQGFYEASARRCPNPLKT